MDNDLSDLNRALDKLATSKQDTPRNSHYVTDLEPTAENLKQAESKLKEASSDEKEELLKWINNARRILGRKDYEEEISEPLFPLLYLKHFQEDLIEHKWPTEDGNVGYFIEAAGDIYRELCKEYVDGAYIAEKERKLKNFFTLTLGDINELIEIRKKHPDYPSKLNEFLEKVCELEKITKDFHFGMYADRKKKMLDSLSVIKSIVKWGKGEIDRSSVEAVISDFISEENSEGNPEAEVLEVPGEKEALELVRYHEKNWKRITKGVNLRDLERARRKLNEAVHNYNQIQRLKPYGRYFYLSPRGDIEEKKSESLIERSRESVYKITLSAEGLPTKNIEDLTLAEAKEYYEAIKKEIATLKERIKEKKKIGASTETMEQEIYLAKERCALALRVIGELSNDIIPQDMLREYEKILWNPSKKQKNPNEVDKKYFEIKEKPPEKVEYKTGDLVKVKYWKYPQIVVRIEPDGRYRVWDDWDIKYHYAHREEIEGFFSQEDIKRLDIYLPVEKAKEIGEKLKRELEEREREIEEEKELTKEHARQIDRLKQLGVEIDKVPAIVEVGNTTTVVGKYDTYRLNFALGEIAREDMPKFVPITLKGKVLNVKKSPEAELLKKKLREEEKRVKQLKLREERRLETYEEKGKAREIPEEELTLSEKLQLTFLKQLAEEENENEKKDLETEIAEIEIPEKYKEIPKISHEDIRMLIDFRQRLAKKLSYKFDRSWETLIWRYWNKYINPPVDYIPPDFKKEQWFDFPQSVRRHITKSYAGQQLAKQIEDAKELSEIHALTYK